MCVWGGGGGGYVGGGCIDAYVCDTFSGSRCQVIHVALCEPLLIFVGQSYKA